MVMPSIDPKTLGELLFAGIGINVLLSEFAFHLGERIGNWYVGIHHQRKHNRSKR